MNLFLQGRFKLFICDNSAFLLIINDRFEIRDNTRLSDRIDLDGTDNYYLVKIDGELVE